MKAKARQPWSPKARYLFKLFMALRLAKEENKRWRFIAACKASQTCFQKVERLLEESGNTDELGFMIAQTKHWGIDKTYPAHLASPYAISIYLRWKEEQVPIAKEALSQEEEMLKALCQARGEPEEKVLKLLQKSGLFSSRFLKQHSA